MAKPTKTPLPRLSATPPGVLGFADGGKPETADELMARLAAKYGAPAAGAATQQAIAQPAPPVQQPQPKPQQGPGSGIIGILKGRQQQIDKAAGYAEGGKIKGPGTAKSDSIPATVSETGEGIKVSNGERIVSKEHDAYLESVAKAAGFESLDQMLEDGTGKPVGPTIKAGKRAAADGMAPELDPFAYRGGPAAEATVAPGHDDRTKAAIAAPPSLGAAPYARSEPAGTLTNPISKGLTVDPFGPKEQKAGSGFPGIDSSFAPGQPAQSLKAGRDESGVITAESAQAAVGNDMQRSGGVFGTIDMAGVNGIMARENAARQSMIDSQRTDNKPGGGLAILGVDANGMTQTDRDNAEKTALWRQDDLLSQASRGNQSAVAAAIHANATAGAEAGRNAVATRGQDISLTSDIARQGITARGQDLAHERGTERNGIVVRGQDIRADSTDKRIASNEAIAGARINERGGPSLAQQRGNAEIDAARNAIAGLTPDEIRRKTAATTNTGRENPDFDPQLERAASLANRRKVGADDHFDQRQQAQPQQPAAGNAPAFDRADIAKRFRSERAMDSHKLGNDTPNGVEVLDASGKVIGHYR